MVIGHAEFSGDVCFQFQSDLTSLAPDFRNIGSVHRIAADVKLSKFGSRGGRSL